MKCIFHRADLDGICSAAIIYNCYEVDKFFGVDRPDSFDPLSIECESTETEKEKLFIVDYSFERDVMAELAKRFALIWIDHHQSAIEKLAELDLPGIQRVGIGACQLVWQWCYPNNAVPKAVGWLAKYDVWDHEDEDVIAFNYGLRAYEFLNYYSELFPQLFKNLWLKAILKRGKTIQTYIKNDNHRRANDICTEATLTVADKTYTCLVANVSHINSYFFDAIYDKEKYDFLASFVITTDSRFKVSLYNIKEDIEGPFPPGPSLGERYQVGEKIYASAEEANAAWREEHPFVDVSKIAEYFGGGGHQKRAGFIAEKILPFCFADEERDKFLMVGADTKNRKRFIFRDRIKSF